MCVSHDRFFFSFCHTSIFVDYLWSVQDLLSFFSFRGGDCDDFTMIFLVLSEIMIAPEWYSLLKSIPATLRCFMSNRTCIRSETVRNARILCFFF